MSKWIKINNDTNNDIEKFKFNEIGEYINGKLLKYAENKKYKDNYYIILENDNNKFIINCTTDLNNKLKKELEDGTISIGSILCIKFVDTIPVKSKKPLNVFDVFVKSE